MVRTGEGFRQVIDVTNDVKTVYDAMRTMKLSADDHAALAGMIGKIIKAINSPEGFCRTGDSDATAKPEGDWDSSTNPKDDV